MNAWKDFTSLLGSVMRRSGSIVVNIALIIIIIALFLGLYALVIGVFVALPTMLLWNALVPQLFDGPHITFWQAFGMYLLLAFLFSAFRAVASRD